MEVFTRAVSGPWAHRVFAAGETFELPSLGRSLGVDDLYEAAGVL